MGPHARSGLVVGTIALLAVLLQTTLVERFWPGAIRPDLVVVSVVVSGVALGAVGGAIAGFCTALLLGLSIGGPLGTVAVAGSVVGYWSGRWGEVAADDDAMPVIAGALVGSLVMFVGVPILDVVLEVGDGPRHPLGILGATIATGLVAVPCARALRALLPGTLMEYRPSTANAQVSR